MSRTDEFSIQEIARAAGTTSRTLRHYDDIGLLPPSRIGANGYRYYDAASLMRLQRILLLRELGIGLSTIAEVLDGERDSTAALRTHLRWLERERERLARQIESVRSTIRKYERGEELMATEAFDGFDHTRYRDEVVAKWGRDAYDRGERWWRSLSADDRDEFQRTQREIAADFVDARARGLTPDGDEVQAITRRHYEWVQAGWQGTAPSAEAFTGLGQLYVDDPRFAANYPDSAEFVRDAMRVYADRNLR
ncbi:MerR family transcriptional regulator [Saccharomonospora iraqiensis]|uniref:MerR family transcriptional regulator n=1 Tax=Saccharomonospora iraqiensis TaxID=52698 RepID=UPI00022E7564|nr:MerR family transcriptional regulator [Saccharomonospora iraqiensis]